MCLCVCQQTNSNVEELRAKPEYHKFLIGRGGAKIRKVFTLYPYRIENRPFSIEYRIAGCIIDF